MLIVTYRGIAWASLNNFALYVHDEHIIALRPRAI